MYNGHKTVVWYIECYTLYTKLTMFTVCSVMKKKTKNRQSFRVWDTAPKGSKFIFEILEFP